MDVRQTRPPQPDAQSDDSLYYADMDDFEFEHFTFDREKLKEDSTGEVEFVNDFVDRIQEKGFELLVAYNAPEQRYCTYVFKRPRPAPNPIVMII